MIAFIDGSCGLVWQKGFLFGAVANAAELIIKQVVDDGISDDGADDFDEW